MKKFNILLILLVSIILTSCGWDELVEETEEAKQDFFVETQNILELPKTFIIKKVWRIESSQDIKLSSNAVWRISSVRVKQWDKVYAGQILATLEDNIWSYNINLSRSKNSLERSRIDYESTEITLNKQIFDLEVNLKNLESNLQALNNDKDQTLIKSKDDLDNLDLTSEDSKSFLELEKIKNNIKKLELDYDSKLIADEQTVEWFSLSLKKEHNSILILVDDVIEFSDKLLWVSDMNKNKDDGFEKFLWWKDKSQKNETKNMLRDLINYRKDSLVSITVDRESSEDEIIAYMDKLVMSYDKTKTFLNSMERTINNSIENQWVLSATEVASHVGNVNAYQASLQWNYTWLIAFYNWTKTFLKTYASSQESMKKQIDLLRRDWEILAKALNSWELWAEVWYSKTVISYDDRITTLESQINITRNNLENAKKTKTVTLKSLKNAISSAQISYNDSSKQVWKLIIKSPISWVVKSSFVDIWQEIWVWTQVFSIVNNKIPEVKVYFDKNEISLIDSSQKVFWKQNSKTYTWSIASISIVADENLKYWATMKFSDDLNLIGEIMDIEIPVDTWRILFPVNAIEMVWEDIWLVKVLSWSEVKDVKLSFWEIYDDRIELRWCVDLDEESCKSLEIILNDVNNFNKDKFNIVVK